MSTTTTTNGLDFIVTRENHCTTFENLSEELQKEVLDKYRYIEVENDFWYGPIQDFFAEKALECGIEIDSISFDLYYRQASFNGKMIDAEKFFSALNASAIMGERGKAECGNRERRLCLFALNEYHVTFEQSSRTDCQVAYFNWENPSVNYGKGKRYYDFAEAVLSRLEYAIDDKAQDLAGELLRMLEQEYEYLTSDEVVREFIDSNDMIFDVETGETFYRE